MRLSHRCLPVLTAAALIACSTALRAAEPVTPAEGVGEESRPSLIQRISHALFQPGGGGDHGGVVQYSMFSPHYGLWQSPDLYADDMRCRPVEWAPQGYGWPKKTSHVRMDYAPYGVRSPMSSHGPALWPRSFREPCCNCAHCGHSCVAGGQCENCGRRDCQQSSRRAPQQ